MFKNYKPYIAYVSLSILMVVLAKYVNQVIVFIAYLYDYVDDHLEVLFNTSPAGILSRNTLALVVCPLLITGIPALGYYAIKQSKMPYFLETTWLVWIIMVLGNTMVK